MYRCNTFHYVLAYISCLSKWKHCKVGLWATASFFSFCSHIFHVEGSTLTSFVCINSLTLFSVTSFLPSTLDVLPSTGNFFIGISIINIHPRHIYSPEYHSHILQRHTVLRNCPLVVCKFKVCNIKDCLTGTKYVARTSFFSNAFILCTLYIFKKLVSVDLSMWISVLIHNFWIFLVKYGDCKVDIPLLFHVCKI